MWSGWVGRCRSSCSHIESGCDLLQMRGLDWLVSSDNTVVLRLGLLGHILDLRKFRVFVLSCIVALSFLSLFVSSSLSYTRRYGCVVVLYFCCCVIDGISFKKQSTGRSDYGFHFFMELSQFVYGLLSRSRKSASLPPLNSWEHYMDVSKVADIEKLSCDNFLLNYEFGSVLRGIKGGEAREFRRQCPDFIDRFVDIILVQYPASSDFMRYIYCFCPELLLEGGDENIFGLFNGLVALLKRCKVLTDVEAGAATEEFFSFVVDVRARHDTGAQHAEEIPDLVAFLLADYSFLARKSLCRVFKLCCLVVVKPRHDSPVVDIDLSGCTVPKSVVSSCIRGVQSCVLSPNYKQKAYFTKHTMECIRDAIVNSYSFMSCSEFDPWGRICSGGQSGFVSRYTSLFEAYVAQKKDETSLYSRHKLLKAYKQHNTT